MNRIGVVCPSIFEYQALDKTALSRKGVTLVQSGMGKLRAMYACAWMHRKLPGLRHILLIGFTGGLKGDLKIGDVIEPHLFLEQDYYAEPFEKFPNRIRAPKKLMPHSSASVMLTQDRFLTENPYRKGPYARRFKTITCDMESYAVAHYCRQAAIRYSVIKLVSDLANETADHDFLKACKRLAPKLNRTVLNAVGLIAKKTRPLPTRKPY